METKTGWRAILLGLCESLSSNIYCIACYPLFFFVFVFAFAFGLEWSRPGLKPCWLSIRATLLSASLILRLRSR